MAKILVADDNQQIVSVITEYLKQEGHSIYTAKDGQEALNLFNAVQPDAVLLDVMMPKLDGFAVCREIRKQSSVPIIMVTARGEDFERIMGLDIGADDYIVKPFSPNELMARLRAVLRRIKRESASIKAIRLGGLHIDMDSYEVTIRDIPVLLTKKEVEILYTLASYPGKVFSRDNLLSSLWGYDYEGDSRTVDSHIKRLRAKLEWENKPGFEIKTIWGVGYKLEEDRHET